MSDGALDLKPFQDPKPNRDERHKKKREKRKHRLMTPEDIYRPKSKKPKHPEDFSGIDVKIGKILLTEDNVLHRKGYSYVHNVDVGYDQTRLIVSDLNVNGYSVEDLQDRLVVVACNVKFRKKHGINTEGWILVGNAGEKLELLKPPRECDEGDQVMVDGYPTIPDLDDIPRLKDSAYRRIFSDIRVTADRRVEYKGLPLHVEGGYPVTTETLADCPVTDATMPRNPATWILKESPYNRGGESDY